MKSQTRLDRRTIQEIERFLEERRHQLRRSVQRRIDQCAANGVGRSPDAATLAAASHDDEIQVTLLDLHGRQVAQIEAALEQLSRHEYGFCHDCDDFIGLSRLRALPFAQRCRPCQDGAERAERRQDARSPRLVSVADLD